MLPVMFLMAFFLFLYFYSKTVRNLKLKNLEQKALEMWNSLRANHKKAGLYRLFKVETDDLTESEMNSLFRYNLDRLIGSHNIEKDANISALKFHIITCLNP